MKQFILVSQQGRQYEVTIPNPQPDLVSAYIFAFARGGSTLLNNMVTSYCQYIRVPTFSLFDTAFDQGVPTHGIQKDAAVCFNKTGCIYTGFRHFPAFDLDVSGAPVIWLVRDPRDMMVSLYYSVLKSHVIPKGLVSFTKNRKEAAKLDINQYVIEKSKSFAGQFQRYQKMLEGSDLKIYRYEDVIYDKEKWLTDVVSKLGVERNQRHIKNIAKQFDVIPETENENKHIRQVHPGNHTRKLTNQTIQELNTLFSDFLKYFNYEH